MTMPNPKQRIPNTEPIVRKPLPPLVSEERYRAILIDMLGTDNTGDPASDPANGYSVFELEHVLLESGRALPIVRVSPDVSAS